ncbi:ribosome hibernation promoting factor [Neptunomonas japonica]|uniref:ribosome hibernation promoting factor n=1 Tax=Neptunomonas japonica TaxID=417574 RepID=UPI000424D517|nr:ribosome hibernation promoting factor [Neptunomonas japonica]
MQINITGHHVELTEPLSEYVHTKFEKLERHFDNITNVQVTLSIDKQRQKAEADMHIAGGEIFATSEQDDMYAAIDGLIDKLDRQVIKHKEKTKSHK